MNVGSEGKRKINNKNLSLGVDNSCAPGMWVNDNLRGRGTDHKDCSNDYDKKVCMYLWDGVKLSQYWDEGASHCICADGQD